MSKHFNWAKRTFDNYALVSPTNSFKQLIKRFFSKKINTIIFILLITLLCFLIFSIIFSPYNTDTSVMDTKYVYNLPSFFSQSITVSVHPNYELENLQKMENFGTFKIDKIVYVNDLAKVTYNPYKLIEAMQIYNNQKTTKLFTFLGTNNIGIDNFHIFNSAFLMTLLICFTSALVSLVFNSILAAYTQWFFGKVQNISNNIILSISLLPSLIIAILFFNLLGYTHIKAFIILFIISTPSFYFSCLTRAKIIYDSEYIKAYISTGFTKNQLIWRVVIWQIMKFNCSIISDQIALSISILAALSFFNVDGIITSLNIGNVFKSIIDNFDNYAFSFYAIIITILFILLFKLLSIKFFVAFDPSLK